MSTEGGSNGHPNKLICNPHELVSCSGNKVTVQGNLLYYHYLCDEFDDCGWGCGYRSAQTICSWYMLRGRINRVPSHEEIQNTLVMIGDKPASFVGSRGWIGSLEIAWCLDHLFSISCKILNVRTGSDVFLKVEEFEVHFAQHGTPVMIGGAEGWAYTLLGVAKGSTAKQTKWLILDPHYRGPDVPEKVVKGSWCAWKSTHQVFSDNCFYNFCLPQCPR